MDIQKEPFLSKDQYECLEFLKTWGLNKVEFDENKQIIGITRQSHCDLSTREIELIMRAWQAKSKVVPENPWVEFGFPELHKDESSDCLTSKEVFFELLNSGGTYHGWYIARPIDKRDQCCCEEEFEDSDVEYEYFFNANVGDELFDEDHISRWMYVPNVKEQSHDQD